MRSFLLAAALVLIPAAAQAQEGTDPGHDRIIDIPKGTPTMLAAIEKARAGLPEFFARYAAPGPGESYFLIKYDLVPGDADEFIWAELLTHGDGVSTARLVNNPRAPGYHKGQQVTVPDAAVIDWSYVLENRIVMGAQTTRALLDTVSPREAAQIRASHGWD